MNRWVAIAALWGVLVGVALVWEYARDRSTIGAGYVAKEVCSCVFVAGRELEACRADIPPSMDRIQVELDKDRVRAFLPGLTERIARSEPPFGCVLY